jgi:Arc/MetJ-type ribon-helix-helix transcriptional regulator
MYGTMYGTMARMLKTTVYLTPDLKARLERVAAQRRQSEADVIRTALEEFTARERPRPTFPLPGAQGEPIDRDRFDEVLAEILDANLAHELGRE